MKKILILIILPILFSGCSISKKDVSINNEKINTILYYPSDTDFATSSDNSKLTFIRDIGDHKPSENFAEGTDIYNQLIIKDLSSNKENIIVQSGKLTELKILNLPKEYPVDIISGISNPTFSNDDSRIYFNASAWTTSSAIFSIDLKTKNIKYITDGGLIEIVSANEFKDDLIINQRNYQEGGGVSYCNYIIDADNGQRLKDLKECL